MTPYWYGVLTGFIGSFVVSFIAGVLFVHFFGFRVRDDVEPERGIGTIQTSTRVHWPDDNADIIDLDERRGITQPPETGRGA